MVTKAWERDGDAARGPVSSSVVSGQAAMSAHMARLGAIAAVVGALVLFASTMLHPSDADPGHAPAAFAEYATDTLWVWSHLGQFAGLAALGAALVALAATLEPGRASNWGRVAVVGATASVAVAAALQAVDGVALKSMVDRWAAAIGQEQRIAFEAALAVRQIEIGLASLVSILFGLTSSIYGIAVLRSSRYPRSLGAVGLAGGLGTVTGGIVQASTGFSGSAMTINMTASSLLLIWMISIAVHMWRLAPRLETDG
jgi:hypothetical protein